MEYRYTTENVITFRDVYGCEPSELKIPEGYESTREFRPPKECEKFLGVNNWSFPVSASHGFIGGKPRLILRKKPAMRTVTIEVEEGKVLLCRTLTCSLEKAESMISKCTDRTFRDYHGTPCGPMFVK